MNIIFFSNRTFQKCNRQSFDLLNLRCSPYENKLFLAYGGPKQDAKILLSRFTKTVSFAQINSCLSASPLERFRTALASEESFSILVPDDNLYSEDFFEDATAKSLTSTEHVSLILPMQIITRDRNKNRERFFLDNFSFRIDSNKNPLITHEKILGILFYGAFRTKIVRSILNNLSDLTFSPPFIDQLIVIGLIMNGRIKVLPETSCIEYDKARWDGDDSYLTTELEFYTTVRKFLFSEILFGYCLSKVIQPAIFESKVWSLIRQYLLARHNKFLLRVKNWGGSKDFQFNYEPIISLMCRGCSLLFADNYFAYRKYLAEDVYQTLLAEGMVK